MDTTFTTRLRELSEKVDDRLRNFADEPEDRAKNPLVRAGMAGAAVAGGVAGGLALKKRLKKPALPAIGNPIRMAKGRVLSRGDVDRIVELAERIEGLVELDDDPVDPRQAKKDRKWAAYGKTTAVIGAGKLAYKNREALEKVGQAGVKAGAGLAKKGLTKATEVLGKVADKMN